MNAVAVKLPDFWVSNPAAWFAQAEAQFGLRTITGDQTKFWYVVSALDTDTATRITCFLDHPPSTEKYPAIKRLLLATFELKEEERAERLLADWCRTCISCQAAKVHRHAQAPVQAIPVPEQPFTHIHVDIVGPLPSCRGFTHLFTVIDRTTRWPEAIPLSKTTTEDCARALVDGWIARFGAPLQITSSLRMRNLVNRWKWGILVLL